RPGPVFRPAVLPWPEAAAVREFRRRLVRYRHEPGLQPCGGGQAVNPTMSHSRSEELFRKALEIIPGGVNSPVRAFRGVGGNPLFLARGQGSHVFDVDGIEYIDYVGSWGPLLLGHRHPEILAAIERALAIG